MGVTETANYRKLKKKKKLITKCLLDEQFIKTIRKNESNHLILQAAISRAVETTLITTAVSQLKTTANIYQVDTM